MTTSYTLYTQAYGLQVKLEGKLINAYRYTGDSRVTRNILALLELAERRVARRRQAMIVNGRNPNRAQEAIQ